jgi:hypothetical protein
MVDDRYGSEAVVGDDIHIVYGSSVPLVIRRLELCGVNGSSAAEHGKEERPYRRSKRPLYHIEYLLHTWHHGRRGSGRSVQ